MAKVIIYENDNGGVDVMNPAKKSPRTVEEIAAKHVPKGKAFEIVEDTEIPTYDIYRNAWKKIGKKVEIHMPIARKIHMDLIREARNEELDELDKEITKMEDQGGPVQTLRSKRQSLRDIPQTFDLESAPTTKELEKKFPRELMARKKIMDDRNK